MGRRKRRAHQRKTEGTNPEPPSSSSHNGGGDNIKEDRDLPEEPLLKILTTFPIKTLCRFRCVSNRWNHIISDPLFVRLYLSQTLSSSSSSSYTLPWTLLHRDSDKFCNQSIPDMLRFDCLYSDQNYNHQRAIISVLDFPSSVREKHQAFPNKCTVLASSNGLLLCCVNFPTIYYVCNPSTRHWVALPYHTQFFRYVSEGLVTKVEGGIITSYKVVRLCCDDESTNYCFRDVEIFSSETDEWKTLKVKKFPKIDMRVRPFSFNGILVYYNLSNIVAYDPYNNSDQCRLIRFPNWRPRQAMCGVCQEHLKYMVRSYLGFEVWVLEDYDNGKWKLEYKIDDFCFGYDALAFHPFDSAVVYLVSQTKIFSYNMLSKRLVTLLDVVSRDLSAFMVLPFVLPLWPMPVPKPSWGVIGLSQI